MFFFKLSIVFLSAILFVAGCSNSDVSQNSANTAANPATSNSAPTPNAAPADELAAARELYTKQCADCHKETGEGGRKEIDGEKIKVPNFKDPRVSAEKDDEYVEQIEKGGDGMPAYKGKISDEEIKNLVRYIRRDFQGKQ